MFGVIPSRDTARVTWKAGHGQAYLVTTSVTPL